MYNIYYLEGSGVFWEGMVGFMENGCKIAKIISIIVILVLCLHKVVGRDHLTEPADAIHHKAKLATALDKS